MGTCLKYVSYCYACAERMNFLGSLTDVPKSEGTGEVCYEHGASGRFESLAAVVCTRWSSAPSGFCGVRRGLNERVWSAGSRAAARERPCSTTLAEERSLWAARFCAGSAHLPQVRLGVRKGPLICGDLPPLAVPVCGRVLALLYTLRRLKKTLKHVVLKRPRK